MTSLVIAFAVSLASTLVLTPLARAAARRFDAVDYSDGERKLHPQPVPLLGGVALYLALVIGAAAAWVTGLVATSADQTLPGALALSAGMICAVGCCDDIRRLRVRWKLLGQMLATMPLVWTGHVVERLDICGYVVDLGWLGVPLTMAWLVTGINALNFLDGVDGLASIIGLVTAGAIGLIAYHLGQEQALVLALVLAGGLAGFLWYNLPPASIFLGDAGSMVIGLVLSLLAIEGSRSASGCTSLAVPLVLFGVPLMDIGLAVVRRTLNGRRFWVADRAHIHHRLLERGLSVRGTIGLLGAVCLASGAAAYAAVASGRELIAWLTVGVLFAQLVRLRFFGHHEWALAAHLVLTSLLDLAARLWAGRFNRGLPAPAELARMPFPDAWGTFVGEVQRHAVERLELAVGNSGGYGWRQNWGPRIERLKDAGLWTLEISFDGPAGGWCKVRALVEDGPAAHPWNWLSLVDVLRLFGRHWAAHPQQMPGHHLRIVAEDGRYLPTTAAADAQRHEAA